MPPAVDELLQDVLGLARKLVAAERLSFGEIAGEQRLGELGFLHLDVEHADAITATPTVAAFLERGWRACEDALWRQFPQPWIISLLADISAPRFAER